MDLNFLEKNERSIFQLGLAIKVFLIFAAEPQVYHDFFLPFILQLTESESLSIWDSFLKAGGRSDAFPYGPFYLAVFAPLTLLGNIFGDLHGASIGLALSVLLLDFFLLLAIKSLLTSDRQFLSTYVYWVSPITIYCCYWHGQIDVLPVLILMVSFLLLQKNRFFAAGAALGLAITSKFSMGIALPFFLLFFVGDLRYRKYLYPFVYGLFLVAGVTAPFLLLPGFNEMVLMTPEASKVFEARLSYANSLFVFVVPFVLAFFLYFSWRIRRFDLWGLLALTGAAFFVLFVFTPASAGWAMWLVPFLALHMASNGSATLALGFFFSFAVVAFHLCASTGVFLFNTVDLRAPFQTWMPVDSITPSLILTMTTLSGLLAAMQMVRCNLLQTYFHQSTRKPWLILIAGDSGTGKDTLAAALEDVFGQSSTVQVLGDDYHKWDRKKPMWRAQTHLNPAANHLSTMEKDVLSLLARRPISARHYDHSIGKMTRSRKIVPRDMIIASGLHTLFQPKLRAAAKLKIFLDMDEDLRRALKIKRDVEKRGHPRAVVERSLDLRIPDTETYITPQKDVADLILKLRPDGHDPIPRQFLLIVTLPDFAQGDDLIKALMALGGLQVRPLTNEQGRSMLEIAGLYDGQSMHYVASSIAPRTSSMLAIQQKWSDDISSLMRVIVLYCLEQKSTSTTNEHS